MKLQVSIGNRFTMNTTPQALGNCFDQQDTAILKDMLALSMALQCQGDTISEYVGDLLYTITVTQ